MPELNASIRDIPMPPRMARRPISSKGFPVPFFVTVKDAQGEWDFRCITAEPLAACFKRGLCWLCGEPLGTFKAFVIGPMCAINRVSSEPPSHRDCAEYAVRACPFLSRPNMRRNEVDLPVAPEDMATPGIPIMHNPGVTLIWITNSYKLFPDGNGKALVEIGPPLETYWYKEQRAATRSEIEAAINKGLPFLRSAAADEDALPELEAQIARAMPLLPVE